MSRARTSRSIIAGPQGQNNRLPALAAQLVQRRVTVIVAGGGTPTAVAAKAATATIPVVFAVAVDPVAVGLVASLDRPGGNVTGVTNMNVEIGPKRLELLHELLPSVTIVAVLVNPANPVLAEPFVRGLQGAAGGLGLQLHVLNASTERDIDTAFAELVQLRAGALVIMPDVFFNTHLPKIATLAISHKVPAVYQYRPFVEAGGLISYGSDEPEYYRLVGIQAGKISQRRKANRTAGCAIHESRAAHQPQDREGARHFHPASSVRARRRDDRMSGVMSAIGTKRT